MLQRVTGCYGRVAACYGRVTTCYSVLRARYNVLRACYSVLRACYGVLQRVAGVLRACYRPGGLAAPRACRLPSFLRERAPRPRPLADDCFDRHWDAEGPTPQPSPHHPRRRPPPPQVPPPPQRQRPRAHASSDFPQLKTLIHRQRRRRTPRPHPRAPRPQAPRSLAPARACAAPADWADDPAAALLPAPGQPRERRPQTTHSCAAWCDLSRAG